MDRRKFLFQSGALGTLAMLSPSLLASCKNKTTQSVASEAGLQLYTLRDALAKDFAGTLKKVSDIGYKTVELFNYSDGKYFGNSIEEIKTMLNDNGLSAKSSHTLTGWSNPEAIGTMTNNWERTVADAAALGQKYIVCAYLFESERESLDDYKRLVDLLGTCGEVCKNYGLQMAYHNHAFEFETLEGKVPYDLILEQTDPAMVKLELDLYWTRRANVDPIKYFKLHKGRFPLWHVKDMDDTEEQFFTSVGSGVIDWQHIFNHASEAGLEQFFVEQDNTKSGKPLQEIKKSYAYLEGITKS